MQSDSLDRVIDFFTLVRDLKFAERYGCRPEILRDSSAAHSWRLALMSFALVEELKIDVDVKKVLEIALIHDLPESLSGDTDALLIMEGKVSSEHKKKIERAAMEKIKSSGPAKIGQSAFDLWLEYENASTREARLVKAVDKLETTLHLVEQGNEKLTRPHFIPNYADKAVAEFPELKPVLSKIKERLKGKYAEWKFPWLEEYG